MPETIGQSKAIGEASAETKLLVEHLKKSSGQIETHDVLSRVAECDVRRGRGYGYLRSALHICLRDHDMVFRNVRGQGYKLCTPEEALSVGVVSAPARRLAERKRPVLARVRREELSVDARHQLDAQMTLTAFISEATKRSSVKRLESAAEETEQELTFSRTLDLFREKK